MDKVLEILMSVPQLIADNALVISGLAVVYEVVARFIKSEKLQSVPRMIVKILRGVSVALEAIAKLGDKVIPDKK